jgi:ATP adenylyltransferase
MAYVGASESPPGCIFCHALSSGDDRARLVLLRSAHAFLILNAFPYTPAHLMAVPNRHVAGMADATAEELADVMRLVQAALRALTAEYRADGFNLGINQGRVAGAGVLDHVHMHVVPRWNGDVNFMPVIGETRVLPESLDATWERLRGAIDG